MKISKTAYDDAFRTLLNDCSELIIPVVKEVFGEHYTSATCSVVKSYRA